MNNYSKSDNTSKAQIEVWDMKSAIYDKVSNLPLKEALAEILKNAQKTTELLIHQGYFSKKFKHSA